MRRRFTNAQQPTGLFLGSLASLILTVGSPQSRAADATAVSDSERMAALEPLSSVDGRASGPNFLDTARIEASTSDTKASISLAGFLPKHAPGDTYWLYGLGGEAPVSKGSSDDISIGTVSGLTAGSSANVSISYMHWPHQGKVAADLDSICTKEIPDLLPGYDFAVLPESGESGTCVRSLFTVGELQKIADGFNAAIKACQANGAGVVCNDLKGHKEAHLSKRASDPDNLQRILDEFDAAEQRAIPSYSITLAAKVNRQKTDYLATTDLTQLTKSQSTGYGGSLTYSYIRTNNVFSGGFSLEKTYQPNDDAQVCSPIENTTSQKCVTGPIGPPTHTFSRIIFAETRWLIMAGKFAIAPRAEYDFTASNYAVRLPIYVAPDKQKALTGGIALGYTNKDHQGFGASVFVGKAFSFF